MNDRRNFLKAFGLGSAVVVGASGEAEVVRDPEPAPKPQAGYAKDREQFGWSTDVVSGVLFDRLDIEKNGLATRHQFFDRGWQNGRGPEHTNVYAPCSLQAPEMFKVDKFGITFMPGIRNELRDAIIRRYTLTFWLGQKYYFRAPLVEAFGGPNSDPATDFKTLYTLDMPIVIASGHYFMMDISSSDPLPIHPRLTMFGVIHGQHARGIQ
jgi:hypothetical protein